MSTTRRVLLLGGTGWLGAEVAREALATGAEVVCLARGQTGQPPTGARLVRADRRDPGAFDALTGEWDEVIEFAWDPWLVGLALDHLADRAHHWTLVSTVSVYASNDTAGADESAPLVPPEDLAQYPDAKVAVERATAARVGDRLLIARPGLIVGPGDPSDRFGYWPARLRRGGTVVVPALADRFVQVIDVADLAVWIVSAGFAGTTGPVNAVGDIHAFAAFLDEVRAATGFDGELAELADATLLDQGIEYWAGPRSLPLWVPTSEVGFAQRSGERYLVTGGRIRPLRQTIARVLEDEMARGIDRPRRSGLSLDEEAALLASTRF